MVLVKAYCTEFIKNSNINIVDNKIKVINITHITFNINNRVLYVLKKVRIFVIKHSLLINNHLY